MSGLNKQNQPESKPPGVQPKLGAVDVGRMGEKVLTPLRRCLSSPATIIVTILIGFAAIVILQSYYDSQRHSLSDKKTEAQRLIGRWNAFEAATSGLLITDNIHDALEHWTAATDDFGEGLHSLARSEVLRSMRDREPQLQTQVRKIENLWSFVKLRTESARTKLDGQAADEILGNTHAKRSLLIGLGYLIGQGTPRSDYLALYSLTRDMGYVVSTSGSFIVTALSGVVGEIAIQADREARRVRYGTGALSLFIALLVLVLVVQSQRTLRGSEQQYRTLQNNLPLGVFRSTPTGRMLSVNPAMVSMFGYDSEEDMLAVSAGELYCDPERRRELVRVLKENGSGTDMESRMRRKDGSILWISSNVRTVTNDHGEVLHYDGILENITDRKRAEAREHAVAREKVLQAKRISGVFAHEIRNALFPARAALDRLKSSVHVKGTDSGARKYASIAERAVSNATATTRLISDFNKLDTEVMPQIVNFDEVINDFLETNLVPVEEQRVTINASGETGHIIRSNRLQLPLVFNNLLVNALDALQGIDNPRIDITWKRNGDFLDLVFEDNGCGIPVGELRRVFEPFFSTKAARDGIGIGLSTSRKIMRMYGGTISVSSREGKGTRFDLRFGLCQEPDSP